MPVEIVTVDRMDNFSQFGPCEICGAPGNNKHLHGMYEYPPITKDGKRWRRWKPFGGYHIRCGLHFHMVIIIPLHEQFSMRTRTGLHSWTTPSYRAVNKSRPFMYEHHIPTEPNQ